MTANKTAANTYSGTLYGPRVPRSAPCRSVGSVTARDGGRRNADLPDPGAARCCPCRVTAIRPTNFDCRRRSWPAGDCTFGTQPNLALATNYQDLWWAAPAGSESGWGIDLTHQGDTIFASWFTYDTDGTPLWLVATAPKTTSGTYTGTLYRTTGPGFNATPFNPASVAATPVGSATFTFTNGNSAMFAYTVNSVIQTKPIIRQIFTAPGTDCSGQSTVVSGTVAMGSPVAGATVMVKDPLGISKSTTTAADGTYTIDVRELSAPVVAVAVGNSVGGPVTLVSMLDAIAPMTTNYLNITPWTTAIAAALSSTGVAAI